MVFGGYFAIVLVMCFCGVNGQCEGEPCFLSPDDGECSTTRRVPDRLSCTRYFQCNPATSQWDCRQCPETSPYYDMALPFPPYCSSDIAKCDDIPFDECIGIDRPSTRSQPGQQTTASTTVLQDTTVPRVTTSKPVVSTETSSRGLSTSSTTSEHPGVRTSEPSEPTRASTARTQSVPARTQSTPASTLRPPSTAPTSKGTTGPTTPDSTHSQPDVTTQEYVIFDACSPLPARCDVLGDTVAHRTACRQYYECEGGAWATRECTDGYYNPRTGRCQGRFYVDCDQRCDVSGLARLTRNVIIIVVCGVAGLVLVVVAAVCARSPRSASYTYRDYSLGGSVVSRADIPLQPTGDTAFQNDIVKGDVRNLTSLAYRPTLARGTSNLSYDAGLFDVDANVVYNHNGSAARAT